MGCPGQGHSAQNGTVRTKDGVEEEGDEEEAAEGEACDAGAPALADACASVT